jgi:hypothetical protein
LGSCGELRAKKPKVNCKEREARIQKPMISDPGQLLWDRSIPFD